MSFCLLWNQFGVEFWGYSALHQKAGNEFCKKYQILEGFTLVLYSFSSKSPHLVPFEFCRHTLSNEIRSFYLIWRLTDWTSPLKINILVPSPSFNLRRSSFKHCEWEASCSDLGKTFAVIYRQGRILSPFEIREMPQHAHTEPDSLYWFPLAHQRECDTVDRCQCDSADQRHCTICTLCSTMSLYLLWRFIRYNKKKGWIQGHNYGRRGGYSDIFWGKSQI